MAEFSVNYGVVGFFDVLGFSAMVEEDSRRSTPKYLPTFVEVFRELAETTTKKALTVQMFSDSIVVAAPLSPENVSAVIDYSAELQVRFLSRQILLRGGIGYGKHFEQDNILFSQALINAYRLESETARFPRVVIDDSVLNYAWHHKDTCDALKEALKLTVLIDRDGARFVHYLKEPALTELTPQISSCIASNISPSETILEKMRWLLDYRNYSASTFGIARLDINDLANGFSPLEVIA